jgi:hypothetical protein
MKELGHLKTYKMRLTTLSPVFIGDGETILGIQNEEDFKKKIIKNNPQIMAQWIDYFMNFKSYKNNRDYRIPKDANKPSLQGFLRFIGSKEFKPNKQTNKFVSSKNHHYIPGSSIKGAIRTALLSYYIKKYDGDLKIAEEKIKEQMKYLSISDSELISDEACGEMVISPQKIIDDKSVGYSNRDGRKNFQVAKEVLYEGEDIYFKLTVDKKHFKYSLDELLAILKGYYATVINENKQLLSGTNVKVFLDDYGLTPNINIGGQTGFNTKVVLRALSRDNIDYINKKKIKLASQFRSHSHDMCKTAPRYLKFIKCEYDNNTSEKLTLGWCHISEVKERV